MAECIFLGPLIGSILIYSLDPVIAKTLPVAWIAQLSKIAFAIYTLLTVASSLDWRNPGSKDGKEQDKNQSGPTY
jgi:hypothetical protein